MGKKHLETRENRHHLLAQDLRDEYNVNVPENIVMMNVRRHEALHKLFWALHTPKEQILEMKHLYSSVLSNTAKQILNELLSLPDEQFYIKSVIKKNGRAKQ